MVATMKVKNAPVSRRKQVVKAKRVVQKPVALKLKKSTLRSALVAGLKQHSGRKDIQFNKASKLATNVQDNIRIEERAGFPVKLKPGCVHPKDWVTFKGVKIEVDLARVPWLPDEWGQGVKITQKTSRSTGTGGGILTTFVAPDGKSFFHKATSEQYAGVKEFTTKDGFNGQVRSARLQAQQQIQLARAGIKDSTSGGPKQIIGTDSDASFFKILTPSERKALPAKTEFHFCVISARRATKISGVCDIWTVQSQLLEAGVNPTWYVDADSLADYQALGLKAVVGGKLTAARNKALHDARKLNKVCVQCSDDISAWEYRHGPNALDRTDDAQNAAHNSAKRFIVSPVAAASFILAKMRSAEAPKPKLGGVYMLGSCSRTFCGPAFSRQHFILGDFFVVDTGSRVNFDADMTLKEDYDFSCAHIKAHGSVMRCQRMTLNVKHYDNGGGACSYRDGEKERYNIKVLNRKWPGCFRPNPKRSNEVIMRWKTPGTNAGNIDPDAEDFEEPPAKVLKSGALRVKKALKLKAKKAKKAMTIKGFKPDSVIVRGVKKTSSSDYITARVKAVAGKKVGKVLGCVKYKDARGIVRTYSTGDLRYDVQHTMLNVR